MSQQKEDSSKCKFKYYIDDAKEKLDPVWVDKEAQKFAESWPNLKTSQLRKFYGDVKTLERQLLDAQDKKATFERILPMIKLLKAKSAYALKRNVIPENFKDWLWDNVTCVNDIRDFEAFLLHFEAVVGFSPYNKK